MTNQHLLGTRDVCRVAAVVLAVAALTGTPAHCEQIVASNLASNYGGSNPWVNGSNQSLNLGGWNLSNNNNGSTLFAGYFLGSSTNGAGDINTAGQSFGVYANPNAAFADADLPLNGQFTSPGRTLRFKMAVNYDNGSKGFNLYGTSGARILNWNLGNGASTSSDFTKAETVARYDYGGAAVLDVQLNLVSTGSIAYQIARTSPQGIQGTLFQGTVSGISSSLPSMLRLYVANTDAGGASQNNLFFNSIEVAVPEPGLPLGLAAAAAIPAFFAVRRRRVG